MQKFSNKLLLHGTESTCHQFSTLINLDMFFKNVDKNFLKINILSTPCNPYKSYMRFSCKLVYFSPFTHLKSMHLVAYHWMTVWQPVRIVCINPSYHGQVDSTTEEPNQSYWVAWEGIANCTNSTADFHRLYQI